MVDGTQSESTVNDLTEINMHWNENIYRNVETLHNPQATYSITRSYILLGKNPPEREF